MEYQTDYLMKIIRSEKKFSDAMIGKCTKIASDIVTYIDNPNCSCKKRIENYINNNKEMVNTLFTKFLADEPNFKPEKPSKDISGTVIEIEADPIKYKKLIEHLKDNNQTYKGLNVMDVTKQTETGETVVWLVFFY